MPTGALTMALEVIQQVLAKNPANRSYYLAQEKRFKQAMNKEEKLNSNPKDSP